MSRSPLAPANLPSTGQLGYTRSFNSNSIFYSDSFGISLCPFASIQENTFRAIVFLFKHSTMRRILPVVACCLLPLLASAKAYPAYNASLPFRPSNVTGLSDIYLWVGSYVYPIHLPVSHSRVTKFLEQILQRDHEDRIHARDRTLNQPIRMHKCPRSNIYCGI